MTKDLPALRKNDANNLLDYDLECFDRFSYGLILKLKTNNKLMKNIFFKTRPKLKKVGIKLDENQNPDYIDEFEVPKFYFKLLGTIVKRLWNLVKEEVGKDKIILSDMKVDKATFFKEKDDPGIWKINILTTGSYEDLR